MMGTFERYPVSVASDPAPAERMRMVRARVALARGGDVNSFAELVTDLHPFVFRWALTFAHDADDAEEITQETFVRMHHKLHQFKGQSALEGWVYLITRNIALERRRKSKRRKWLSESVLPGLEDVYTTDPGARVDRQRLSAYIRHFFVTLPPRQREVFDLVDLQGHEPAEVADLIGSKPGVVRANLFKARAAIRGHLMELHPAWREIDL